ncbi:MAG TPA: acyltransferase [Candidatus Limnocylindria bacterium]|nr:acyltransferase [Candidatus Limnocylindria bacterium]
MPASPSRSAWVDNLRTTMVLLVVNMHACVTYSHVGSWYINESPEPDLAVKMPFLFWQGHLQSFFMGLLFFLAGVFAPGACQRRGPGGFVRERLLRLGAPALLYMVLIHPFMVYVLLRQPDWPPSLQLYGRYLTSSRVLSGSGPLWFAIALLLFSAVFAAWRTFRPAPANVETPPPRGRAVFGFALLLVSATFALRLWWPIDSSLFNMQLCFFAQYIAAFAVGVYAGRHGWLDAFASSSLPARAGWVALVGGPVLLLTVLVLGDRAKPGDFTVFKGGWHPQAFGLAAWEQLTGLGLALGALALFRRRVNFDGPGARWLSQHSFGVYVLHAPVLVALTPLLRPLPGGPFVKVPLLTVLGLVASYGLAWLARLVPGLRRIL